ncbi:MULTISPECIES: DHA2 family efflux MFS transporter permease subunit [unclassified Nitratiruptor]|uniref:DHA2 family efflux MFS transporter permease subunit n=1 Tax=unclassified Nitratiruptor TaxID=2624044 RepID=UPI001914FFB9|nr:MULTISPECIES: DHA2 family efflux MFS transporter permease subunit [unclassified Nitratiruptor]BCD60999.1 MFS transporter, DHA2 family, multidrug resistance protein [Nitratiruptor sp. YY08-10]BCD64931.1 MFS transporter, DHA2 family, multidrug resistance protein [Nitratiruptor sp. YY08-14]
MAIPAEDAILDEGKKPWNITSAERAIYSVIVMAGAFMAILDTTVVDVIVPKLTGPLATDLYGVQWIITSYMIAAAIGLLITEWLIKNFGSKKIFLAGVALFTVASFACGISNALEEMILFRVLQGVGEAFIMVTSHIMIFSYFPPHQKGLAMGIFALGVSFAPSLGPTIGGYLTEFYNWRMVFFINVPVGILLFISGAIFLPKEKLFEKLRFNFVSFILLSFATVSLLIMLSKGQQYGWFSSSLIGLLLVCTIIGFLLYALSEINSKYQLIDFSLFKNFDFFNGMMIYFFILGFSMYQYFYLLPVYYERIKMLPTLNAGIAVFAFAVFIGIFSPIAGILSDKIGAKKAVAIAAFFYVVTSIILLPKLNYYTPMHQAMLLTIPFGIGMGLFFAPVTVMVLQSAPQNKGELAIVLMDYFRFVGGSFGTALATNNMEYFKNMHFLRMNELQNYEYVHNFLHNIQNLLGMSWNQVKIIFGNYEEFMSFNYGFYNTFMHAGYWGILGVLFVVLLFIKIPKGNR